jgi:hypothetical protein
LEVAISTRALRSPARSARRTSIGSGEIYLISMSIGDEEDRVDILIAVGVCEVAE